MKRILPAGAAAFVALLCGCTTIETRTMDDGLATQVRGQAVAIVTLEPSTFAVVLTRLPPSPWCSRTASAWARWAFPRWSPRGSAC